jgi:hypothetical protein
MNERIRELMKQAGYSWHNEFSGPILSPNAIEKFAELIVRECADWIDRQDESRCPYGVDLIEHFGVE